MKGVILDLDGVLWRGSEVIEGSIEAVGSFLTRGLSICYLTNNSTRTGGQILSTLMEKGYPQAPMVTSAQAAANYISIENGPSRCLSVGEEGLHDELSSMDHQVVKAGNTDPGGDFDFVVAGLDRQLTYAKIKDALLAIRGGARFIATNTDPTLPSENGNVLPGAGTIISAISKCSGVEPFIVGKPNPYSTRLAVKILGNDPSEILVIGDRPDTDMAAGMSAGCRVAMVLTGDVRRPPDARYPVFKDLLSLSRDERLF